MVSADAGLFFIALTIVTGITSVMYSLFTISFPALSAMKDGRKRFTINTIRLSLIIAIPFSTSLIFYSEDILGLLGDEYMSASSILDVLLLAMLPTAIQYGITSLVYSYGNYRQVLFLGLAEESTSDRFIFRVNSPFRRSRRSNCIYLRFTSRIYLCSLHFQKNRYFP